MCGKDNIPFISIIVVNYNGREHLEECFQSLNSLSYPLDRFEILMVDNGSKDDSVKLVEDKFTKVKIIRKNNNTGFAKGNNDGARETEGDYLAFLNNDMRVDENWLSELVRPLSKDENIVCTCSKILDWEGKRTDFVGGSMNFYGHAFQMNQGEPNNTTNEKEKAVLFPCGGSMLIDRQVFLKVGGFDEDYFAFFEDVDLGWRLWIFGYKVIYLPKSICYHRGHATAKRISQEKLRVLHERNALYTIFKNYEDSYLNKILPVSLLLALKRVFVYTDIDSSQYSIRDNTLSGEIKDYSMTISGLSVSHLIALNEFVDNIPRFLQKRLWIQKNRARKDKEIFSMFEEPFATNCLNEHYEESQEKLSSSFGIKELFKNKYKTKVLIICNDVVDKNMAGPAIRYWEFSKSLCHHHKVVLAIPNKTGLYSEDFQIATYDQDEGKVLKKLVDDSDVIIVQGYILHLFPFLKTVPKPIVVDLYDPYILENIEVHSGKSLDERLNFHGMDTITINEQLNVGDFFICASEKQMDFWIGMLTAIGRINPLTYDEDKTMRKLIDVVPFGLSSSPPTHNRDVLKGVFKSIKKDDKVILWGGGIWEWFDPITLIESMYDIVKQREDIKLFFLGTKHPNPKIPKMTMTSRAIDMSKKLGLYDRFVFFNDWVPYADRQNYLLEADIGVSLHMKYIESRFSFRTRILDYIWAGIPIVATVGDSMSEIIERYNLGKLVDFQNRDQLTRTMLDLIDNPKLAERHKKNIAKIRNTFTWESLIQPLSQFCKAPKKTVDKGFRKDFVSAPLYVYQLLEDKESHISNLEKINQEKDGHIKNLQQSLREMDEHIRNIRKSIPYRVYLKLRFLKRIFGK